MSLTLPAAQQVASVLSILSTSRHLPSERRYHIGRQCQSSQVAHNHYHDVFRPCRPRHVRPQLYKQKEKHCEKGSAGGQDIRRLNFKAGLS